MIDQTRLPHELATVEWRTLDHACHGIASMQVRGAPLIGVAAAHGLALALAERPTELDGAIRSLAGTRPTAVNLRWALEQMAEQLGPLPVDQRAAAARALATEMADHDVTACRRIGEAGVGVLADVHRRTGQPVQVLTHCNAGRLACVEWGTATAPVYLAAQQGVPVHVWVSETRPRNQGASLTAWELADAGVDHTLVVDNAAGHLLREHLVDLVIVGADRIAANGDTANKIGTSLKALAAREHGVPFLVAAPWSTIDPRCATGAHVPIEERDAAEVLELANRPIAPPGTRARNWAFDITPAEFVTGYLTDAGHLTPAELRARRADDGRVEAPGTAP